MPSAAPRTHKRTWWKEGVVYQIYPASFQDTTGSGVGDIQGIIRRLDHVQRLGATIIWVCPIFKSPQIDNGYDISDYQAIDPVYGSMEDVEQLIDAVHEREMKIIFDLVINHTSDQHEWFIESRSSKTNPKRDWYIWRPPRFINGERHPPCNWRSAFGGSVWQWDELTREYYLHLFAKEQPDLNWDNEDVRRTLYEEVVRFWLEKGIDGYRIDTANKYSKRIDFLDAPITAPTAPFQPAMALCVNGPRIHEFLQEMHRECFSKYDCVTIGEVPHTPDLSKVLSFISEDAEQLDMVIQFDLADLDHNQGRFPILTRDFAWQEWKHITAQSQAMAEPRHEAWVTTYLENHDQARSVSRFGSHGNPQLRVASAKMLATYLLTLTGTPIIYQGGESLKFVEACVLLTETLAEEIGMRNCPEEWSPEEYRDVNTVRQWRELQAAAEIENDSNLLAHGLSSLQRTARDHARTPMQWDTSLQGGFSTSSSTWMRVMDSYTEINVATQEDDPASVLNYYRQLLQLRAQYNDLLVYGSFELLNSEATSTMIYLKRSTLDASKVALVALNFDPNPQRFNWPDALGGDFGLAMSNSKTSLSSKTQLAPFEARVYVSNGATSCALST
ncbi:hypothetical protein ACM66B_003264 [Microbotryomycetes sp. NB124-2]